VAQISIQGLTKRFPAATQLESQGREALSKLDLEVADGELLVVVGPSGCGKSTLLRLIAGLEQPNSGSIELDGEDLAELPPQKRDVAMVFQGYALYPHLRVRQIIAFPLKMRKVAKAEQEKQVTEVAELLGLSELLDRRPGQLSGGEQQRVAMARAIVRSPKAFLFDEPLSNLDAKLRAELRVELAALVRRLEATALYVTHDQAEAMTMGDRVAVLRAGELQQVGPPRAVYEDPANVFVAGFLGTPGNNLIALDCEQGQARAPGICLDIPAELVADEALTVAIRPEHVHIIGAGTETLGTAYRGRVPAVDGQATPIKLEAEVVNVEPLGAETFVYLDAGGTRLRARLAGMDAPAEKQTVRVHIDPSTVLWFDTETGERLRPADEVS